MAQQTAPNMPSFLDRRRAGILLHISSLPSQGVTGELGSDAYRFVDFLAASGMSIWQMLPVGPTMMEGSPYQTSSAHAGNPQFISLEPVMQKGWLDEYPLDEEALSEEGKQFALSLSWEGFKERAGHEDRQALERFIATNGYWLQDYALFKALQGEQGGCWWLWSEGLRARKPQALAEARARLSDTLEYIYYEQFLFFTQWWDLKRYANGKGVFLFGDMPIFVAHDSAEVWAHPQDFYLDESGLPSVVAGVPPDYFSETGQRWGNPLYRWDRLEAEGFRFWVERMQTQLRLFDIIRIDHFRGLEAYWEIPASEETAVNGRWVKAPGEALFDRLYAEFDALPLVAEDLGIITPEVEALRRAYHLPGMKILQFAFSGGPQNPYLPFNHSHDSVVYTGTHDNDTTLGWYTSLDDATRHYVDDFLGRSKEAMPWPLIRCAMMSHAQVAIVPMQDVLGLGSGYRMNTPGTTEGNWRWRFIWEEIDQDLTNLLRNRVRMYGREAIPD